MSKRSIADAVDRLSEQAKSPISDLPREDLSLVAANILVRSNLMARQMLHHIALDERSSMQALAREAINALLVSHGKPPIA